MQTHQLQPTHISKGPKRVGRGGKKGTYSGKGGKGQTARAGRKLAPIIRELIKRYPKLKGYRRFEMLETVTVINLETLEKKFKDGETVSPQTLMDKKLVRMIKGKLPEIKILGNGALSKKLTLENCKASASAKAAIEKAGGVVK